MAIRRAARRKHTATSPRVGLRQETVAASAQPASLAAAESRLVHDDLQELAVLVRRARRAAFAGDDATAIPLYVEAISRGCASAMAFNDLGTLLAKRGHLPPAVVQFEIAVSLEPASAEFRRNLCTALDAMAQDAWRANRLPDAAAAYTRLAELDDRSALSQTKAAMALRAARSAHLALPFLRRAVELEPYSAGAHANLGAILYDLSQREAETELVRAIELDPRHTDAHVNLAAVCNRLGELTRAANLARRALDLAPDHAEAHAALGGLLREQGEVATSIDHYRRAIGLRPDSALIFSSYLLTRQGDPAADADDLLVDHRAWAARFVSPVAPGPASYPSVDRDPDRRLRVGYVSADFRQHAVASFIEPIIQAHNRAHVHVTCYSDGMPDVVTTRIREVARPDAWRDVRLLTDDGLAKQIIEDRIDVLVDLAGHTAGNRLLTFARRPAPVQVTYCGYPGTTGLSAI
ncbi:MAG: tetratricopeptide repeat protein, partial [Myxococcales bacterium]